MNDNITDDIYEIEIGNTTYIISHEYGSEDLSDIITDYLDEKINMEGINTAA